MRNLIFGLAMLLGCVSAFADDYDGHHGCAVVFAGDYGYGYDHHWGDRMFVRDGEEISNLGAYSRGYYGSWDNAINGVSVNPGCEMVGWQYRNFDRDYRTGYPMGGFAESFHNFHGDEPRFYDLRGSYVSEKISSLVCHCSHY